MQFSSRPISFTKAQIAFAALKFPFTKNFDAPSYLIIHDKVYDVNGFIDAHPGGPVIISKLGEDASDVFDAFHSKETHELLANFYIGDIENEIVTNLPSSEKDFAQCIRDLKQEFLNQGLFESNKFFFFLHFSINVVLLFISLFFFFYFQPTFLPLLVSSLFLALFWQQCGWLSHDILHHSVFQDRTVNTYVGYFLGGVCQGFSVQWWKQKHNTHHSEPNIHEIDPDIHTLPFLAWSTHAFTSLTKISNVFVSYQTWLYYPLLFFARLSWMLQSILFTFTLQTDKVSDKCMDQVALTFHWIAYLYLVSFLPSIFYAFLYVFLTQALGGLLLASVFSLNHNGMQVFSKFEEKKWDFFSIQVLTGRDIHAHWLINWFCGGLNFQIEHHLFPTMPRHNYPRIQPIIVKLCQQYGLTHHTTGFWKGTKEVLFHLHEVSNSIPSKTNHHSSTSPTLN